MTDLNNEKFLKTRSSKIIGPSTGMKNTVHHVTDEDSKMLNQKGDIQEKIDDNSSDESSELVYIMGHDQRREKEIFFEMPLELTKRRIPKVKDMLKERKEDIEIYAKSVYDLQQKMLNLQQELDNLEIKKSVEVKDMQDKQRVEAKDDREMYKEETEEERKKREKSEKDRMREELYNKGLRTVKIKNEKGEIVEITRRRVKFDRFGELFPEDEFRKVRRTKQEKLNKLKEKSLKKAKKEKIRQLTGKEQRGDRQEKQEKEEVQEEKEVKLYKSKQQRREELALAKIQEKKRRKQRRKELHEQIKELERPKQMYEKVLRNKLEEVVALKKNLEDLKKAKVEYVRKLETYNTRIKKQQESRRVLLTSSKEEPEKEIREKQDENEKVEDEEADDEEVEDEEAEEEGREDIYQAEEALDEEEREDKLVLRHEIEELGLEAMKYQLRLRNIRMQLKAHLQNLGPDVSKLDDHDKEPLDESTLAEIELLRQLEEQDDEDGKKDTKFKKSKDKELDSYDMDKDSAYDFENSETEEAGISRSVSSSSSSGCVEIPHGITESSPSSSEFSQCEWTFINEFHPELKVILDPKELRKKRDSDSDA